MKIQSLRFTVFLLICLLIPLMATAQTVNILDLNLRAKIETALEKDADAPITEAEMATLTRLKAPYSDISDLTGLEHATSLKSLDLRRNSISDISPLAELTKLTSVILYNNSISDISPLEELTELDELHLDNNSISDISPLARLTNMRWLLLQHNLIEDISPLAKLTRMGTLNLAHNSVSDISALSGLTNLNLLVLTNNRVSDISALKGIRLLNAVVLTNNMVSDIEPLVANQGFRGFREIGGTDAFLYLRGNPLSDTSINTHVPTLRARGVIVDIGPTIETLAKVSGDNQQGVINTALVNPFVVEVQDENGSALSSGIEVTFSITRGGGTLSVTSTMTDDDGRASSTLTLGPGVGTNTVSVSAEGIQRNVIFTAEAVAVLPSPTTLLKISGDNQQGVTNTALANPFVIEVRDANNNPFVGGAVTFSIIAGGGTLSTTNTTTNTNGRASSTLTLGASVGSNTVSVSAAGIQEVEIFTAEAVAAPPPPTATTLDKISGENQQGVINTALANPFIVEVRDQTDSVLSGIGVTFSVTTGGGTLSTTNTTTNTNGRASSTLTLGASVGSNTVSVSAAGIQEVEIFTAEAVAAPPPPTATTLDKISGENQQGVINTALANPFIVEVRDQNGSVLSGIEVTFSVTAGGGTLGTTSTTTDASGRASSILTLGSSVGTNTVSVSAAGIQGAVTFTAEALSSPPPPTATTLVQISGDGQQGVINTALGNPFVVEVRDQTDSVLSGIEVTFTVTAGGGTLGTTNTTTSVNGRASSTLTLGSSVGTNTVSVSAAGIQGAVTFTAEAQSSPPPPTATTLVKISGDNQQGVINTALGNPFVVEVRDQTDSVLSGIEVTFTVTAGGGTLGTTSTTTNANGRASSTLTLGSSVGTNTVSVSAAGIQGAVTFTAEAQSSPPPPTATTLVKISGDNQQGVINTALGNPFVVEVRDQTDSVLSGIEVTFTVTAGGGTLGTTSTTTNANGRASSTLTLGSSVGTNTVSVSAAGIQGAVTFTAEAQSSPPPPTATTLVKISGDNQQGVINTALGNPFVVEVRDQNNSVLSGIEVTFTVTAGGGTLGTTSTTTNANGRASSTLTLGSSVGTNTVSVSAAGIQGAVTFTAEAQSSPPPPPPPTATTLVKISGDNQQGVINTALGNPFVVEVRDQNNSALSGIAVTFSVTTGGGTLSTTSTTTNTNGRASSTLTLGASVGTNTVSVSAAGIEDGVTFTAVAVASPPPPPPSTATTLVKISGDNQQGVINTALANPFFVEVRDQNNSALSEIAVTFAVTTGGGTLSTTSTTTDTNGRASSTLTLGSSVGPNTVSVSAAGIEDGVTFTAEAVATPPPSTATTLVKISGDNQQGVINAALANPFIVEVRDQNNSALSGIAVTFAVTTGEGTLSTTSTTTDTNGRASSILTLGASVGSPTVSVSAAGIEDGVTFTAVVVAGPPPPPPDPAPDPDPNPNPNPNSPEPTATTLVKISGDNQQGVINTILGSSFVVEVRDESSDPLEGVAVTFAIIAGGGTLRALSTTTNANGRAESWLTLGPSVGTNTVSVSAAGIQEGVTFTAEAVAGPQPPSPPPDPPPSTATTLVKISGDNQQGVVNTILGRPFVVEVRDESSDPLEGVAVTFSIIAGGGTLSAISTTTNANGQAESTLTLGASVGTNTVSVSATGIQEGVTFNAEAVADPQPTSPPPQPSQPTMTLVKISGDSQQGVVNTILGRPFVVEVRDESSDPLEGVAVTFAIIAGGGTLSAISTMTDANGQAESWLTLGSSVGTNTVSVSAAGIQEGVTFTAEAVADPQPPSEPPSPPLSTATTLDKISGDNQQGVVNTILGRPFVVEVRDESSDPLEGVAVTFAIIASGGTLSATNTTTDANGRAESWLTLGASVGTNTVSVSAAGIQEEVTFTTEAVAGPQPPSPPPEMPSLPQPPSSTATTLDKISGDNQQGVVNTILGRPFVVEVRDESSDPLEGVAVTFAIIAGGGTLSAISTTTNANGRAESWLTLGSSVGTNTVSVSAAGIQEGVTFTAEAVADPQPTSPPPQPSQPTMTLVKISGDNQQGVVNTILGRPFVVEVRDESSDPLEGVAVTFSIIAGGGTLSAISTMTDANGRAESWLTLGPSVGTNTVSVSAAGIQEGVTFTVETVAGPQPPSEPPSPPLSTATTLVKISGDNQQGVINMILGRPFVVEVRDESSDPLEGVAVTFSIIAGGGTLSAISTTTDANGQAESWLTLGSSVGTNAVSVSAAGIQEGVTFTALAETSQFDLSVPSGISLIHIPLKVTSVNGVAMTIESVGDLYDALGGANTVNYLITYDPTNQQWLCYMGPLCRGLPVNKILTDSEGIIAVMNHAVSLRLGGSPLGTPLLSKREALITLHRGINLVGMSLRDSRIARVSDLFSLEGIEDNVRVMIVLDNGTFKVIGRAGDDGDIQITGGQSYILIAQIDATAVISGDGWSTVPGIASAPPMALIGIQVEDTTPVLAVTGLVVSPVGKRGRMPRLRSGAGAGFRVTVKNLSTGRGATAVTEDKGVGYQIAIVDLEKGRAAQIGDILEISAQSPDASIRVQPLRYTVTPEDVKRSRIQLDDLVAYEIPAKTELLLNYPNPFNPETWIPYRLAEDANVTVTIYDLSGGVVRRLNVGHQVAAVYESREKAVYWDGRTEFGERVASGIYFYHLSAGDYSATRKMVILK